MRDAATLTLVLGGARSGKSRHAEAIVEACSPPWIYLATAQAFDDEMVARIAQHRTRLNANWQTHETPIEVADFLAQAPEGRPLLLDCATLWLTNVMLAERDVDAECCRLLDVLGKSAAILFLYLALLWKNFPKRFGKKQWCFCA